MWSSKHLLLLRAARVPIVLNCGGFTHWKSSIRRLEAQTKSGVGEIWPSISRALRIARKSSVSPLLLINAPLGADALAHPWPDVLLLLLPLICPAGFNR